MKCFACDKKITGQYEAVTSDGLRHVRVGQECWKKIKASKTLGYQSSKDSPRLFLKSELLKVGSTK